MTSDEIKSSVTMKEVLSTYGISVGRNHMASCPFHGADKHPSMRIYPDGFHCFTCGANGDIFSFIQLMDNCDFKTAFISLGGDYAELSDQARLIVADKRKREHEKKLREEQAEINFKNVLSNSLAIVRDVIANCEPFSDEWCLAQTYKPIFEHWWEEKYVKREGVPIPHVYRVCQRFGQRINSLRRPSD